MIWRTAGLAGIVLMGGCALRVSTPAVTIEQADLSVEAADLVLRIDNPNRRSLTLAGIDYTLTDGAFPIARGSGPSRAAVPAHGSARVPLHIPFTAPLAGAPSEIDLHGELRFLSGVLGFAEVSRSPFEASWRAR